MPTPTIIQTPAPAQKTSPLVPIVIVGGLSYLGYRFVLKPLIKKGQDKAELNALQTSTVKTAPGKPLYNVSGKPIQSANLGTIAVDLFNALHPGWYKPTDQSRVVRVFLNDVPYGMVNQLEQIYLTTYGENLRKELADKLSDENFIKIKYYFK